MMEGQALFDFKSRQNDNQNRLVSKIHIDTSRKNNKINNDRLVSLFDLLACRDALFQKGIFTRLVRAYTTLGDSNVLLVYSRVLFVAYMKTSRVLTKQQKIH